MLLIAGSVNVIYGIAAISDSSFYANGARHVLFDDLSTWGWVVTIVGVTRSSPSLAIWAETSFGRWLGVRLASGGAVVQLLFLPPRRSCRWRCSRSTS